MRRIVLCLIAFLFCAVPCFAQPYLDSFDFHIISPSGGETYHQGDTVNIVCTAPDPTKIVLPPEARNATIIVDMAITSIYEYVPSRDGKIAVWKWTCWLNRPEDEYITTDTIIARVYSYDTVVTQCDSIVVNPLVDCGLYSTIRDTAKWAISADYGIWIDTCTDTKDTIVCRPECDPNGCWPVCDTFPVQHCGSYYFETKTFYDTTGVFSITAPASVHPQHLVTRNQRPRPTDLALYSILGRRVTRVTQGVCIGRKGLTTIVR